MDGPVGLVRLGRARFPSISRVYGIFQYDPARIRLIGVFGPLRDRSAPSVHVCKPGLRREISFERCQCAPAADTVPLTGPEGRPAALRRLRSPHSVVRRGVRVLGGRAGFGGGGEVAASGVRWRAATGIRGPGLE